MKQISLGIFMLGHESVEVVAREGTGGEFYFGEAPARIKIGVEQDFDYVMATAMHEALEFCIDRISRRLSPANDIGLDHAAYYFILKHPEFSDCVAKTALFIELIRPHLLAAKELMEEE